MKNLNIRSLLTLILIISFSNLGELLSSDYTLKVMNIVRIDSSTTEFDIYLKNTNPGNNILRYFGGQYMLYFNPLYGNGGNVTISRAPGDTSEISDLPAAYWPIAAKVFGRELWISSNPIPPEEVTPVISQDGNGTKVIRMRLQTTSSSFEGEPDLRWKNKTGAGYSTKLNMYVNGTLSKVTDSLAHSIVTSPAVNLNVKLAIEGLFDEAGRMNRVETVNAYLRESNSPYTIVDSAVSEIDSLTLTGQFNFENAVSGSSYYLVMRHMNSLETWSGAPVIITGDSTSYNFTTASSKAFGNNMKLKGSKWCLYSGDVTQDGIIDLSDVLQIHNDASGFTTGITDLNGDGSTDLTDLIISSNNSSSFVSLRRP